MHKCSNVLLVLIFSAVTACVSIQKKEYYYNEIVVRNNTSESVQDVVIRVIKTHRVFRCTNIAPRAHCSDRFYKRKYMKNPIMITWAYHDSRREKNEFVLDVPSSINATVPLRGVLEIKSDGTIVAYFEQD